MEEPLVVSERHAQGKLGAVSRVLSLTFDDGPAEVATRGVLKTLQECDVQATFFMVGERVRAAPSLARAVLDAGHEVQLHCDRHVRHTELSESEIERDTTAALETFAAIGVRPTHWRTPWGVRTAATASVAHRHRLTLVGWTIDTHDWRGDPAPAMLARARSFLAGGGIVLMHDALGPGALRAGCENTIGLLAPLIALAHAEGLGVGPLSLANAATATATEFSQGAGAPASTTAGL
jgi:peptidoglycan/xylan/chitin deacetylase (PgdA/CDA1 family)